MKNKGEILRKNFIILLIIVAAYSGSRIFTYFYEGYSYARFNDDIRDEYYELEHGIGSGDGSNLPEHIFDPGEDRSHRFKRLWDTNSDIVGWVRVPGTKIDYPVVQKSNNEYYLRRNLKKEWALRGTIFMDYRSHGNTEDLNTVIYGHNMKDGSMFGNLSKYKKKDYFEENQYVEYDYPGATTKWQIFSVYIYKPEDDFFIVTFSNQKEYEKFLNDCKKRSIYDTGVLVEKDDRMLTLMTCTYETDDARLVVNAKLVE